METYSVKFTGLTPLLMHFDNIEAQDDDGAKGRSGGKAGDDRYPAGKWKTYLYTDIARQCVAWPASNVLSAVLNQGSSISIGGKKTLKTASQAMYFAEFYLDFLCDGQRISVADIEAIEGDFKAQQRDVAALGFSLLVAPCRVNGKRHIRVRPMFPKWEVRGVFSTDDPDLTAARLPLLFDLAGMKSGFGDWRPSSPTKPGPYGRFKAEVQKVR